MPSLTKPEDEEFHLLLPESGPVSQICAQELPVDNLPPETLLQLGHQPRLLPLAPVLAAEQMRLQMLSLDEPGLQVDQLQRALGDRHLGLLDVLPGEFLIFFLFSFLSCG